MDKVTINRVGISCGLIAGLLLIPEVVRRLRLDKLEVLLEEQADAITRWGEQVCTTVDALLARDKDRKPYIILGFGQVVLIFVLSLALSGSIRKALLAAVIGGVLCSLVTMLSFYLWLLGFAYTYDKIEEQRGPGESLAGANHQSLTRTIVRKVSIIRNSLADLALALLLVASLGLFCVLLPTLELAVWVFRYLIRLLAALVRALAGATRRFLRGEDKLTAITTRLAIVMFIIGEVLQLLATA